MRKKRDCVKKKKKKTKFEVPAKLLEKISKLGSLKKALTELRKESIGRIK